MTTRAGACVVVSYTTGQYLDIALTIVSTLTDFNLAWLARALARASANSGWGQFFTPIKRTSPNRRIFPYHREPVISACAY